mgnify:CR=1 FL=1
MRITYEINNTVMYVTCVIDTNCVAKQIELAQLFCLIKIYPSAISKIEIQE